MHHTCFWHFLLCTNPQNISVEVVKRERERGEARRRRREREITDVRSLGRWAVAPLSLDRTSRWPHPHPSFFFFSLKFLCNKIQGTTVSNQMLVDG